MKRFDYETEIKKPVTREWIEAFQARASRSDVAALALFMFATGARISEALELGWESIDFANRRVLIRQTKIGSQRLAHLPGKLLIILANLPRASKPFALSPSTYVYHWQKTIEAAGIEDLSFHSCRHGFATGLLRAGIDVMTVAKLGGWKSAQHVFQTYGHANDDPTLTDRLFDTTTDTTSTDASEINGLRTKTRPI